MLRTLSCFSRPPAGKRQSHQVSQSGTRRRRRRWQPRPQPRSSSLAARRPLRQRRRRPVFVQLSNSVSIRTRECECVFGRSVGRRSVRYLKTIIEECTKLRRRERERDTPRLAIGIWMLHRCCGGPSDTAVEELPEVRGTLRAVNEDRTREYWHGAERKREVVHRKDRSFSWNNEEYKERSE